MKKVFEAKIEGNVGTRGDGVSHVNAYIAPFLSKEERQKAHDSFQTHGFHRRIAFNPSEHGEHHDENRDFTHTLNSSIKNHPKGTPVNVTGVYTDPQGRIMVNTKNHGSFQASKLEKPAQLARRRTGKEGIEIESKIATNLGSVSAGTSGAYDYTHGPNNEISGKVFKNVEGEEKKPILRGESKASKKGNITAGTATVVFDKATGTWGFGKGKKASDRFKSALTASTVPDHAYGDKSKPELHENGERKHLSLLDYLNKHHKDGVINSGITARPAKRVVKPQGESYLPGEHPEGITSAYLYGMGANSLHLHRVDKSKDIHHGTTFTVGDDNELRGKTNIGHLEDEDLDNLDGQILIKPTGKGGKSTIQNNMRSTHFNRYADLSRTDSENHSNLHDEEHASRFVSHVGEHIRQQSQSNPYDIPKSDTNNEEIQYKLKQFSEHIYSNRLNIGIEIFEDIMNLKIDKALKEKKKQLSGKFVK